MHKTPYGISISWDNTVLNEWTYVVHTHNSQGSQLSEGERGVPNKIYSKFKQFNINGEDWYCKMGTVADCLNSCAQL